METDIPREREAMPTEAPLPPANSAGERIAIIVDSCCDVLPSYLEKYPFFVIPVMLNYPDRSYLDRVDITPAEVYARFPDEIPKTSTPTPAHVYDMFEKVVAAGYTHAICVNMSSALSSTAAVMEAVAVDYPQLTCAVIDTLNIGIGAGINAMYAAELMERGLLFADIVEICRDIVPATRIFIIPNGLEYLHKGGRINSTVYQLGTMLNLCPIITCDTNGYYAVCGKAHGRRKALKKAFDLAKKAVVPDAKFRVVMAQGAAEEDYRPLFNSLPDEFPDATEYIDGLDLSPALVVHTGPGLIGIVVQNFA